MYRFVKVIERRFKSRVLRAEFEIQGKPRYACQGDFVELDDKTIRTILDLIDMGVYDDTRPEIARTEFEKGLKALLIAKDGGLQSLLDPRRVLYGTICRK